MKRVVALGGGTGLYTVLNGLKLFPLHITSVVSMMDDGGSTGRLRDEFGVLPPGDIRRSLVALSQETPLVKSLFQYRFENGKGLRGHSFGNLFLTALKEITGSDAAAIAEAGKILKIKGEVLPVTLTLSHIVATLEDGTVIKGQSRVNAPAYNPLLKIVALHLAPPATTTAAVSAALLEADLIVIGPGDLFTSVIPNLAVRGVVDAIRRSKAKKVYVVNLMTRRGETTNFSVGEHTQEIVKLLGPGVLDVALYNTRRPSPALARRYQKVGSKPVVLKTGEKEWFVKQNIALIGGPFYKLPTLVRHNGPELAKYIVSL